MYIYASVYVLSREQYYFLVLLTSLFETKAVCVSVFKCICMCSRRKKDKVANSLNQVKVLSLVFGLKHGDVLYFGKSTSSVVYNLSRCLSPRTFKRTG